ncbi:MAG: hypothetical protein JXA21_11970 [Anaerolineae bacterium]|nr:hypothetical protein [Anaerolineae bacterium]
MSIERPDLSEVSPEVLAYIESLEAQLAARPSRRAAVPVEEIPEPEPNEPPTTINVITLSAAGTLKRTPRHLYERQRRGGMGIFDLDTPETAPPIALALADESATLIAFSDQGRGYRFAVNSLVEAPVHARGASIAELLPLRPEEHIIAMLPENGGEQIALAGVRGWVTLVRASFVGKSMIPGITHFEARERGPLASACWVNETDNVFIASRSGVAIRFPVRRIPKNGCLGIRLEKGDVVCGVTGVQDNGSVFLLGADGKGTLRLMSGFAENKSPGGGGKTALKTDTLVGVATAGPNDDIFIISRNGKIIRFRATEIPPKEGVVQGVNCMALRSDETTAVTVSRLTVGEG